LESARSERTVPRHTTERAEAEQQSSGPPAPEPSQDHADNLKEQAIGLAEPEEPAPVEAPTNVDVPAVIGDPSVGSTLSCTMGNWTGTPDSYSYQWKQDDTVDVGSGASDYTIVAGDAGHSLTCVVTATNSAGSTTAPPSNAVAVPAARAASTRATE